LRRQRQRQWRRQRHWQRSRQQQRQRHWQRQRRRHLLQPPKKPPTVPVTRWAAEATPGEAPEVRGPIFDPVVKESSTIRRLASIAGHMEAQAAPGAALNTDALDVAQDLPALPVAESEEVTTDVDASKEEKLRLKAEAAEASRGRGGGDACGGRKTFRSLS